MRLVCPSCSATYEVADAIVPQSGQVRCARCGGEWRLERPASHFVPPTSPEPEPEPGPEPEPSAAIIELAPMLPPSPPARQWPDEMLQKISQSEPETAESASRQRRNILAAWLLTLVVIILLVAVFFIFRADIQRVWPPSARLFQLFGV